MALNAKNIGGNGNKVEQPTIEAGVYPARTVQIIDLGLQPQRPYQGQDKAPAHEVMFTYELVDTFLVDEDGNEQEDKPRWISETFPLNGLYADKAKSTKRYKALDPNEVFEGDFSKLTDIPCNVTLVNNESKGKTYTNVAGIAAMRPRDAQNCPELKNPVKVFDLAEPDMEVFNSLPQWIQDKIKGNLEFNGSPLQAKLEGKAPKKEEKKKPEPEQQDDLTDDKPWD